MTHFISKEAALSQIDKLIEKLKDECNPDPLGTTEEMLTAGEIEALGLAKDIINELDTSTDAFIEKAEEYIYKQLNEGYIECGDIMQFIDDFKNFMKEE